MRRSSRSGACLLLAAALGAWAIPAATGFAQTASSPAPMPPPPADKRGPLNTLGGIFGAEDPDIVVTLRGGIAVSPSYFGSDDYEVGPDLAARLDYVRFPGGFEFGSGRAVGFRSGFGIRTSVRYIGEREGKGDIRGLEDVDWSFEAGLGVGYEQRNYRVFTDVRYGIIGHNAFTGEIGADGIAYPTEGLTLTLGPRLDFGDDRFSETYFGVTAAETAESGIDTYEAKGGLMSAGVELGARYLFNQNWGVEGAASWDRLMNDAADSPITENEDQYKVRLGITRSISLDF